MKRILLTIRLDTDQLVFQIQRTVQKQQTLIVNIDRLRIILPLIQCQVKQTVGEAVILLIVVISPTGDLARYLTFNRGDSGQEVITVLRKEIPHKLVTFRRKNHNIFAGKRKAVDAPVLNISRTAVGSLHYHILTIRIASITTQANIITGSRNTRAIGSLFPVTVRQYDVIITDFHYLTPVKLQPFSCEHLTARQVVLLEFILYLIILSPVKKAAVTYEFSRLRYVLNHCTFHTGR